MIFINLSENASDFQNFINPIEDFIKLNGLCKAKIAARKILGTVADERLPVALNEIRQLEGK